MKRTYSPEELETVQREKKVVYDFRTETTRQTIYEIKEFSSYVMITKERGNVTQYSTASNALTLCLNR